MRFTTRCMVIAALSATVPVLAAVAQSNPSSDDILKSLRPGAGFSGQTRGIRPTMQVPEPAPERAQSPSPGAVRPAAHRPATVRPGAAPTGYATTGNATTGNATMGSSTQAPSVNLNIPFASGSADLTPTAVKTLNDLGRALANPALNGSTFRIEGHTDTVGNPDANKALSARRAATVVDYLVEHYHLDRSKLEAVGMGQEGLLIATPEGRAEPRNRRVQVVNTGA